MLLLIIATTILQYSENINIFVQFLLVCERRHLNKSESLGIKEEEEEEVEGNYTG